MFFNKYIWGLLVLLLALVGGGTSLLAGNMAVLALYGGWFLLGVLIINVSFPKHHKYNSLKLYVLFFVVYYLYMYITNTVFVVDKSGLNFFFAPDSIRVYYAQLSTALQSNSSLAAFLNGRIGRHAPAFGVIMWVTGNLASFIDANSMLVQKIQVVFCASMIVVFLYNMAVIYFDKSKAWMIALTFGLFSHLFLFSAIFLRDIHIAFLFTIGFYVLLGKKNMRGLIILSILCFIVWNFRIQHGIFFLSFIGVYLYLFLKKRKKSLAVLAAGLVLVVVAVSILAFYVGSLYQNISTELQAYTIRQEMQVGASQGLLNKTPGVLEPAANVLLSQIVPFPFFTGFYSLWHNRYIFLYFPRVIATFYWVIVWCFVGYGLFRSKLRKSIPIEVKSIFLIAIFLIIGAGSTAPAMRRLLCVYPAFYLFGSFVYYRFSKDKRRTFFIYSTVFYGTLMVLYYGLKILF